MPSQEKVDSWGFEKLGLAGKFEILLFYGTHPRGHPPIYIFFKANPSAFFGNIAPLKYRINAKINSRGKVISFCLED